MKNIHKARHIKVRDDYFARVRIFLDGDVYIMRGVYTPKGQERLMNILKEAAQLRFRKAQKKRRRG